MINYTTRKVIFENNFKNNTKVIKNITPASNLYDVLDVQEGDEYYLMEAKSSSISCRCKNCRTISNNRRAI